MNTALLIALKALKRAKAVSTDIGTAVKEYLKANPITVSTDKTLTKADVPADGKTTGDELKKKATGEGITLMINDSGGLRVMYDDGK